MRNPVRSPASPEQAPAMPASQLADRPKHITFRAAYQVSCLSAWCAAAYRSHCQSLGTVLVESQQRSELLRHDVVDTCMLPYATVQPRSTLPLLLQWPMQDQTA